MSYYHRHRNDYSTNINFPKTIDIKEQKAPTDESIRLMEEMHDKAMKNIIAKVRVENNVVSGECFACEQPWNINDLKLIFKFKINGQEFTVEKEVSRFEFIDDSKEIAQFHRKLESHALGMMVWYALRKFSQIAYEQIMKEKFPDHFLNYIK